MDYFLITVPHLCTLWELHCLVVLGKDKSNFLPVSVTQAIVLRWAKYSLAMDTIGEKKADGEESCPVMHVNSRMN